MQLEEIEKALAEALPMRSPVRDPDGTARAHIERLEDYLLRSAQVNGNLAEASHWLRMVEAALSEQWDKLTGWEAALTKPRARWTKQDIHDAKVRVEPVRWAALQQARRLRLSIEEQMGRFEREERVMSRAYTMAAGT